MRHRLRPSLSPHRPPPPKNPTNRRSQVGGSDLAKQQEQLGTPSIPVTSLFDFGFAENGLTAYRLGVPLASHNFIQWLGEDKYKQLVNFCLVYLAGIDIPVKRGTFIEFRYALPHINLRSQPRRPADASN